VEGQILYPRFWRAHSWLSFPFVAAGFHQIREEDSLRTILWLAISIFHDFRMVGT